MRAERVAGWVPYKVSVLVETVVFGAVILVFFGSMTGATLRSFPQPYGYVLVAGLVLTAAVSLYGIGQQRFGVSPEVAVRGALWERAAQIGFGILLLVYGIWALALIGATGFWFAGMLFSRGIAAILTVIKIDAIRKAGREYGPS